MAINVRASMLLCLMSAASLSVVAAAAPITCNSGAGYGAGMAHPNAYGANAYGAPGYYGGGYSGYPSYYPYHQQNYQQGRPFYPSWPQSSYPSQSAPQYGATYAGGQQPTACGVGAGIGGYSGVPGSSTQGGTIGGQGAIPGNLPPIGPISAPEIRCFKAMPPDGQLVPIAPGDIAKENALVAAQRAAELQKEIEATKASCLAKIQEEEQALKEAQATAGIAPVVPPVIPALPPAPPAPVEPVKANVTYVDPNAI